MPAPRDPRAHHAVPSHFQPFIDKEDKLGYILRGRFSHGSSQGPPSEFLMKKQIRFAIGIGVVLLAIAYFAFAGYNEGKAYYKTIAEVAAMGPESQSKRLRVAGLVKEGTIVRDGRHVSFVLAQDVETMQHTMRVNYVGTQPVPDTFKDRAEAVVEGKCRSDGTFEADHIQAKCASKYEAKYGPNAQHPAGVTGASAPTDTASGGAY
jgi:cytochrome c-type biogenesis protein CcmE